MKGCRLVRFAKIDEQTGVIVKRIGGIDLMFFYVVFTSRQFFANINRLQPELLRALAFAAVLQREGKIT